MGKDDEVVPTLNRFIQSVGVKGEVRHATVRIFLITTSACTDPISLAFPQLNANYSDCLTCLGELQVQLGESTPPTIRDPDC